jgi:hypothetical protein
MKVVEVLLEAGARVDSVDTWEVRLRHEITQWTRRKGERRGC